MEIREALKEQYHAGLEMLAQCVERCPDDLWLAGRHPRFTWRVAFHAAFFTQYGMGPGHETFEPWPGRREDIHPRLWTEPAYVEPYELPEGAEPLSRAEILDYVRFVDSLVDSTVDGLDLASEETGFPWIPNMSKLSQQLENLRHIQGHVGQLSELLMAREIDVDWVGKSAGLTGAASSR
jgi:hypothetical protein